LVQSPKGKPDCEWSHEKPEAKAEAQPVLRKQGYRARTGTTSMLKRGLIIALAVFSTFGNSSAYAAGPAGLARGLTKAPSYDYITERRRTMAPFAHIMFCSRNPVECKAGGGSSVITLTDAADRQLRSINSAVNRSIIPVNDVSDSPADDVWQVNVKSGDCEDFALTKRDHLINMGWSPNALRIAVTKTPAGEGHAVLVVKTDRGDLVLDNRTNTIKGWRNTDLRWLMIQSGDDPHVWYEL
jgi:predicted transglutaminase-like cysteine proteinase